MSLDDYEVARDAWLAENDPTHVPIGASGLPCIVWDASANQLRYAEPVKWNNGHLSRRDRERIAKAKNMDRVKAAWDGVKTGAEIAKELGLPKRRVNEYIRQLGLRNDG